jgi:hypothetical protein
MTSDAWVTMAVASRMTGIHASRISRWAKKGKLTTRVSEIDNRSSLVNVAEVRRLMEIEKQEKGF